MRYLIALVLLMASAAAQATLIRVDAVAGASDINSWNLGSTPESIDIRLLLDTSAATYNFHQITGDGVTCIGEFNALLGGQLQHVLVDEALLGGGLAASASTGGQRPSPCRTATPQGFFGGLGILAGDYRISFSYDPISDISVEGLLASTDPLATLLLSTRPVGATAFFVTPSGTGSFSAQMTFTEVPEPSSLFLLLVALTGIGLQQRYALLARPRRDATAGRRRRTRSALVSPASAEAPR